MDISELYSTRIQKTFDDDLTEIFGIFKSNPTAAVKLITYYKGLPLSYAAKIASVDRGTIDLDVQAEQAYTIEHGRYSFIRSPLFKHDLFAHAQYVNLRKRAITLTKFSYVEIMAERRNFLRLEFNKPVSVMVTTPQGEMAGHLHDVSLSGLNILVDSYHELARGSEVSIAFRLCDTELNIDFKVRVPGTLIGIADAALPYNYKFAITPDKETERQLSKYIFQRQIDIIREIKDAVLE